MNSKECRATRREIEQSELHQRLSDPALRHIGSCSACREFHDQRTRLRELVGSLEPVAAPGDFDMRLRARIAAEQDGSPRASFLNRFVVSTPAIAVAALIVMLAGSIVWFAQHKRDQGSSIAGGTPGRIEQTVGPNNKSATTANTTSPIVDGATNPPPILTVQASRGSTFRETGARSAGARGPFVQATDFNATGAESIRRGEVSLSAPVKPLVVSLEDGRGAKRRISLPPVSFGSQRLVDNRMPVSSPNSRNW
jgi:hypothetical protein